MVGEDDRSLYLGPKVLIGTPPIVGKGSVFKKGLLKLSKIRILNKNNWLRIGYGYKWINGKKVKVFRIAWGAHKKYISKVHPLLRKFNKFIRKIGGGHWDLWVD